MRKQVATLLAVLSACVLFQAWFMGLTPRAIRLGDSKLSTAYTVALGHGQSYLLEAPDPRLVSAKDPFGPQTASLMLLDTSFFRGRYYMYFGIVPFATFMVPWLKVMGSAPPPELAILLFLLTGYAAYGGVLLLAVKRWYRDATMWQLAGAMVAIVAGSGTLPLMGRPAIYEMENSAAYAFFALSLFALALHEFDENHPRWALALSAGFAAAVMGCRPNYFPAVTLVSLWIVYRSWKRGKSLATGSSARLAAIVPLIVVGASLAFWNYHRFGNPTDFGLKHTVSEDPSKIHSLWYLKNIRYNLYRYTLGGARIGAYFPYIEGVSTGGVEPVPGQERSNQLYGFIIITPVILFGLSWLLREKPPGAGCIIGICSLAAIGNLAFLSTVGLTCYRYPADFQGPMAIPAALAAIGLTSTRSKVMAPVIFGALLAWSLCGSILETFSVARNSELYDELAFDRFNAAAKIPNTLGFKLEAILGNGPSIRVITLTLPEKRIGRSEPLYVDGELGAQDFLYAYYPAANQIQVGFESSGYGGILSAPLKVNYKDPHEIRIKFGSFLPPRDHPIVRALSETELALQRTEIEVELDGKIILQGPVHLHPVRAQEFFGQSPFDPAFGRLFTGRLSITHLRPLTVPLSPSYEDPTSYGPITFSTSTLEMPSGVMEPLLSMGYRQAGAQLLLEHLDLSHARLVWLDTTGTFLKSPDFAWPSRVLRRIRVDVASLFPASSRNLNGEQKTPLSVQIDGRVAWSVLVTSPDVPPSTVTPGTDTLGLGSSELPTMSQPVVDISRDK